MNVCFCHLWTRTWTDINDITGYCLVPDGEERSSDGGYNLEGTVDTADKLDISGGTATISTGATTTTTISINNNNNTIANNNTSVKSEDVNSAVFQPEGVLMCSFVLFLLKLCVDVCSNV